MLNTVTITTMQYPKHHTVSHQNNNTLCHTTWHSIRNNVTNRTCGIRWWFIEAPAYRSLYTNTYGLMATSVENCLVWRYNHQIDVEIVHYQRIIWNCPFPTGVDNIWNWQRSRTLTPSMMELSTSKEYHNMVLLA